jgi:hypothetical protein
MGKIRNEYKVLVGKPGGKRPLGKFRLRWEGNIKMHLMEVGWEDVGWIRLTEGRVQWRAVVNASKSSGSIKGRNF